jgi:hypothetical protein
VGLGQQRLGQLEPFRLDLGPELGDDWLDVQAADHDRKTSEVARYKLGRLTADGYHRVECPAVMGKIRCPLRPASMRLDRDRPEILTPRQHPGLLHPADPHRPAGRERENQAETRLPLRGLAPLLRPPHQHAHGPASARHDPKPGVMSEPTAKITKTQT